MSPSPARTVRYRATVEYDGAGFHGYQIQPAHRTVQGVLEARLGRLFDRQVRVLAAGRTDAGVHAVGQEIVFDAPGSWDAARLERATSGVMPSDVRVGRPRGAAPGFHPRFDATGRRYEYYVGSGGPLRAARVWAPPTPPDEERLVDATALLPGRRCFESLSRAGQPELGTVCTVEQAGWTRTALGDLRFTIVSDRFLHRMVRYLVATLLDVARGRRAMEEWSSLLELGTGRPPEPAPANALYLTGVRYAEGWNRRPGVPGLSPPDARAADAEPGGDAVNIGNEMEREIEVQ